jgi:hypothetical protein
VDTVAAGIAAGDIAAMDMPGAGPAVAVDIVGADIVAWDTLGAGPVAAVADIAAAGTLVVGIAVEDIVAGDTPPAAPVQRRKRLPTPSRRLTPLGHFSFSASLSPPMTMTVARAAWFHCTTHAAVKITSPFNKFHDFRL